MNKFDHVKWYKSNRDRLLQYKRKYYQKNKSKWALKYKSMMSDPVLHEEYRRKRRTYRKKYYRENKSYHREWHLRQKYNIGSKDFDELFLAQGNVCAVCGTPPRKAVVDHCHSSGRVRGILCDNCNKAMGLLKDSTEILRSAANYLERIAFCGS